MALPTTDGLILVPFVRMEGIPLWVFRGHDATHLVPDWVPDTDVTHIDGLDEVGDLTQSVSPSRVFADVGNLSLSFVDLPESGTGEPFRFSVLFGGTSRAAADATVYYAHLAANLGPDDVSMSLTHLNGLPANGQYFYVGNETVRRNSAAAVNPLPVTRCRFPAVDGWGTLPIDHRTDPARAGLYTVTGQRVGGVGGGALIGPYNLYNRLIALYFTWIDSNGKWGAKADAVRRWIGRIVAPRDSGGGKWVLDCKPITKDLERQVFATSAPQTEMQPGIELRGMPPDDRRIKVVVRDTAYTLRIVHVTVAAVRHPSASSVAASIQSLIAQAWETHIPNWYGTAAGRCGELDLSIVHNTGWDSDWPERVIVVWEPSADAVECWIELPEPLAVILGWAPAIQANVGIAIVEPRYYPHSFGGGGDWYALAPGPYADTFWDRRCSYLRVTDTGGFTSAAMGDASNPAIDIGGFAVGRYSGISGDDFVFPPFATRSNYHDFVGARQYVHTFEDERAAVIVRQVYMMPRTFGAMQSQNIFYQLLRLMTSTGSLVGSNGPYDVHTSSLYGLSIPRGFIDVVSFEDAAAMVDAECQQRQWVFRKPTKLSDVLDAEGYVLGFWIVMNASGQIALRLARRLLAGAATVELTEYNKGEDAGASGRATHGNPAANIINTGRLRYNFPVGGIGDGDPQTVDVGNPASQSTFGEQRGGDVEHRGLFDFRPRTGIEAIIAMVMSRIAQMSWPRTIISRSFSRDLFTRVIPGDVVNVTDRGVIDTDTGLHGIVSRPFTVLEWSESVRDRRGRMTAFRDGVQAAGYHTTVCPSAEVTAAAVIGAGPNWRLTLSVNEFSSGGADDDVTYFQAGDVVEVLEGSAANPAAPTIVYRTIVAVGPGANQIDIDGNVGGMTPLTDVVYLTFAKHATDGGNPCVAAQTSRGTWIAGTDGQINNLVEGHVYAE